MGFLSHHPSAVVAQSGIVWEGPTRISRETDYNPASPRLTVDTYGVLHVFYSDWMGEPDEYRRIAGQSRFVQNVILYTYLQDGQWSTPVDVLATQDTTAVVRGVVFNPATLRLHIVWRDETRLYVSSAPAAAAVNPRVWRTDVVSIERPNDANIAIDQNGTLHLVYSVNIRDLYYTNSTDDGATWSTPTLLASAPTLAQAYDTIRLVVDPENNLHLLWQETNEDNAWNPTAVWYSRAEALGQEYTWYDPIEFVRVSAGQFSLGQANIGFGSTGQAVMIWNRGAGSKDGRYYRWSDDNGRTWTASTLVSQVEGYSGLAGWSYPVWDSAGNLHLIMPAGEAFETPGSVGGIYHSLWKGTSWSRPEWLSPGEFPDVALSNGNWIHIICNTFGNDPWLAYIRVETNAPHIPSPEVPSTPTLTKPISGTMVPELLVETPEVANPLSIDTAASIKPQLQAYQPILISLMLSGLVMCIVFFLHHRRNRR